MWMKFFQFTEPKQNLIFLENVKCTLYGYFLRPIWYVAETGHKILRQQLTYYIGLYHLYACSTRQLPAKLRPADLPRWSCRILAFTELVYGAFPCLHVWQLWAQAFLMNTKWPSSQIGGLLWSDETVHLPSAHRPQLWTYLVVQYRTLPAVQITWSNTSLKSVVLFTSRNDRKNCDDVRNG